MNVRHKRVKTVAQRSHNRGMQYFKSLRTKPNPNAVPVVGLPYVSEVEGRDNFDMGLDVLKSGKPMNVVR